MKPLYLIITLLVVLLINDFVLLNFVGYFEEKPLAPVVVNTESAVSVAAQLKPEARVLSESGESSEESSAVLADELVQESADMKFIESFQQVATTRAFSDIMDSWQMQSQSRYREFSRELQGKTEDELYELAMNADGLYEQQTAMQKLLQGNIAKLSVDQLKALYHNERAGSWSKSNILGALLDKNDIESVGLAKQVLQRNPDSSIMGNDLLQRVYEKDPKFITRYLEDVGLDSKYTSYAIVSLLRQEPELAEGYMNKHFEQVLETDNRWVHQLGLEGVDFELSDRHQEGLLEMMSTESRQKRQFALGFAHRIEDTDSLRNAFGTLINDRDKKTFLTSLLQKNPTDERKQLARQLANEMNDPELLKQFQ